MGYVYVTQYSYHHDRRNLNKHYIVSGLVQIFGARMNYLGYSTCGGKNNLNSSSINNLKLSLASSCVCDEKKAFSLQQYIDIRPLEQWRGIMEAKEGQDLLIFLSEALIFWSVVNFCYIYIY